MSDPTKEELKRKILGKLSQPTLCAMATVTAENKPWVRYVTPFADDDLVLWLATFANSRKIGHIRRNPEVHLTTGVTNQEIAMPYLQIEGRAEILGDAETKKAVWFDYLGRVFTGPDDPNYVVCKIVPYRIEWQEPESVPPQVWEP